MELVKKLKLVRMMQMAFELPHDSPGPRKGGARPAGRGRAARRRWRRCKPRWPCRPIRPTASGRPSRRPGSTGLNDRAQGKEANPAHGGHDLDAVGLRGKARPRSSTGSWPVTKLGWRDHKPADYDATKVDYEAFFNYFEPFYLATGAVRRGLRAGGAGLAGLDAAA